MGQNRPPRKGLGVNASCATLGTESYWLAYSSDVDVDGGAACTLMYVLDVWLHCG